MAFKHPEVMRKNMNINTWFYGGHQHYDRPLVVLFSKGMSPGCFRANVLQIFFFRLSEFSECYL